MTGWAVAIAMAQIPWLTPHLTDSRFDDARFLEIAILTWVALVYLTIGDLRQAVLALIASAPALIKRLFAALALLTAASALHSRHPASALTEISLTLLLLLFTCGCAVLAHEKRSFTDRIFCSALVAGALIFITIFVLSYRGDVAAGKAFSWVTPFVTFANIRFFSQYQAYTLPVLVLPLFVFKDSKWGRITALAASGFWWAFHFASGTRSLWLALMAATLALLILLRQTALPWLRIQGRAMLLGGLIYSIFAWWTDDFGHNQLYGMAGIITRGMSASGRLELWQAAGEMIRSSPWLGVGPMHFGLYNFEVAAHPHNTWLQIAAEYGLPTALLLTFLVLYLLYYSFRWCRKADTARDRNTNTALTAGLICGLTDSLFSGNTLIPHSQLLLFFITGWLTGRNLPLAKMPAGLDLTDNYPAYKKNTAPTKYLLHTALLIVISAAIAVQFIEAAGYYNYRKKHGFEPTTYYHPRYWQDGHSTNDRPSHSGRGWPKAR